MPQAYNSNLTVDEVITRARDEAIGSSSSSLGALQDSQMIEKVEQINSQFILTPRHLQGGWSWMKKLTNFQTKAQTNLDGAIVSGAASLDLTSASDFDASGRIVIETAKGALDFVDYESKATNTLTVSTATGAETINMSHADDERVEKLYAYPFDLGKIYKVIVNSNLYYFERFDGFPNGGYFTTYGQYFLMPRGLGAQDVTLWYFRKPATLTALTDTTDIPADFQRYAIEMLKAHIFTIRRKRADIGTALTLAENALENALSVDMSELTDSQMTTLPLPY